MKVGGSVVNIVLYNFQCPTAAQHPHVPHASYSVWCHGIHLIYIGLRLFSMDHFSIIDKNNGTCCKQKQKKYCLKFLALFSIMQTDFTHRQLLGNKKFLNFTSGPVRAIGCHKRTTILPSLYHLHNRGQCRITRAVMYYIL